MRLYHVHLNPLLKAGTTAILVIFHDPKHIIFNASFDMMKLDGSSKHKHTVTATIASADFKVAGKSSTRTYSGTATI
jgi:hypothetical protein